MFSLGIPLLRGGVRVLIFHKVSFEKHSNVQPGTSEIKCNKLQVRFTLGITQADSDSLSVKHAFADSEKVSRLLEPVKSSKSCFFGHRLTSNFHNVNHNSNEFYMY